MTYTAPDYIKTLIERGALFVVNHSGGKDSQAMLIRLLTIVPRDQLVIVHAELPEADWDGIKEHIETNSFGLPVEYCVAVNKQGQVKTFFDMVEHRGMFPSPQQRQCTSDLKRTPIEVVIRRVTRERNNGLVVDCVGLRAEESTSRAKAQVFKYLDDTKHTAAGREWYQWLPIHELTTDQVFETIEAAGQEPHWAYKAGMSRLSCCFCIMSSKADLATAVQLKPELARRYAKLERKINHSMSMERRFLDEMFDLGDETVADLAQAYRDRMALAA